MRCSEERGGEVRCLTRKVAGSIPMSVSFFFEFILEMYYYSS